MMRSKKWIARDFEKAANIHLAMVLPKILMSTIARAVKRKIERRNKKT